MIELFLNHSADLTVLDKDGHSVLYEAVKFGNLKFWVQVSLMELIIELILFRNAPSGIFIS